MPERCRHGDGNKRAPGHDLCQAHVDALPMVRAMQLGLGAPICSVADCKRYAHARNLCVNHYQQLRRLSAAAE